MPYQVDVKLLARLRLEFNYLCKHKFRHNFEDTLIRLYVIIMSRTSFRVNLHFRVCLNVKELLARSRRHISSLSDSNRIRTHNHIVVVVGWSSVAITYTLVPLCSCTVDPEMTMYFSRVLPVLQCNSGKPYE